VPKRRIVNEVWTATYAPAAVGTAEVVPIFSVQPGHRVVSTAARKKVLAGAGTTSTVSLGDGTALAGFIAAIDTETGAVNDLIDGQGTMLANSGGRLYLVADTIDAQYIIGATPGAVNPVFEFRVVVRKEW
jgi:hypothetical protein